MSSHCNKIISVRGTKKTMTLEISADGKSAEVRNFDDTGKVSDMKLIARGKNGKKECTVESIQDGTIIYTSQCSPGCGWVFWGGKWWYVC
jgi:hypothetical protein